MEINREQLKIIKNEIRATRVLPKHLASWNSEKEPLVMLALVVSGAKPGATLPAWFNKKHLKYIKKVLEKIQVPHTVHEFRPPEYKKKVWIVDVAKSKSWLERFENGRIEAGTFYGYPKCCQSAYYNKTRQQKFNRSYPLIFTGLLSCKSDCLEASNLAEKYDKIIASVLPKNKYKSFKRYYKPMRTYPA